MKTPEDSVPARAMLARADAMRRQAETDARCLRRLLAEVCQVTGPLPIHIESTRVWAEVDGHRYTLVHHAFIALMVSDTEVIFRDLVHLAELLEMQVEVQATPVPKASQKTQPWWRFW